MKIILQLTAAVILFDCHVKGQGDKEVCSGTGCDGYRGYQTQTRSGYTCQKWDAQYPHEHTRTSSEYPEGGLEDNNFCRNPDGGPTIWCYTTDASKRWEACDPIAETAQEAVNKEVCISASCEEYRGDQTTTRGGYTC